MVEHPVYTNRLINEKSPYLLQHAHNPVDWFPWGTEAFEMARTLDRPILLSIGYATCHWCHVMEKESFENVELAQYLNQVFINIKIDREELPEVDNLYMEFAQSMMAGAAGWPLNVFLTPDLQPFFAATYLPPHSRPGMMGLAELAQRLHEVWESDDRERVISQASKIVEVFTENVHVKGFELPEKEQIIETVELLFKISDPIHGGIKGVPKFPIGYQYNLLIHYYALEKDSRALFIAERTLDMMQRGGIFDHLGGGFSRYSTDETWLIPHFEKMLYDNALLISSYLEAWQMTKKSLYKEICEDIIRYILRDMKHPEGGFYSAQDADSEGHEGWFYTWPYEEVIRILGEEESVLFCEFYQVTKEGNFEGRNILHTPLRMDEFAKKHHLEVSELSAKFKIQKELLWKTREARPHPFKDDKILSSWNGLLIHSLAQTGSALGEELYLEAAVNAARFIKKNLWINGRLMRRWRDGEAGFQAGLDEYAFLIRGLLSLFEANCGTEWLEWALELNKLLENLFKIEKGAYFQTEESESHLILRKTQYSDGAEPSGNAIQTENLLRLYQITWEQRYLEHAEDVMRASKKFIDNYPPGYCYHIMNLNRYYDKHAATVVLVLGKEEKYRDQIRQVIFSHFNPHLSVIWVREGDKKLLELLPHLKKQTSIEGKTTFYFCENGICKKPLTELSDMMEIIYKL